jgi:predicted DCC family thiol-disulfide oxidoreductase YuxK
MPQTIHAIQRNGTILKGTDALKQLYAAVGLGWAAAFGDLPIISTLVEWVYELLSRLRLPMGKGMDAVLAMRRMKMTSEGIEHCVDDEEECQAEW